jgi:hypothetical protein
MRRSAWIFPAMLLVGCFLVWVNHASNAVWKFSGVRGSGKIITQHRSVADFSRINALGAFVIDVTQASVPAVTVEADDNIVPLIGTDVKHGELKVTLHAKNGINVRKSPRIHIRVPSLDAISATGACSMHIDKLHCDQLKVDLTGACHADIGLDVKQVNVGISGACSCTLSGTTTSQFVSVEGASSYKATALKSEACEIEVDGASSAKVHVTRSLHGSASGTSILKYSGHPASVDVNASGLGQVKAVD